MKKGDAYLNELASEKFLVRKGTGTERRRRFYYIHSHKGCFRRKFGVGDVSRKSEMWVEQDVRNVDRAGH